MVTISKVDKDCVLVSGQYPPRPHVSVAQDDLEDLLFCAVAYAITRDSYMVGMVQDWVRDYVRFLPLMFRWKLGNWIQGRLHDAPDGRRSSWEMLASELIGEAEERGAEGEG